MMFGLGLREMSRFGHGVTVFGFVCGCALTLDQSKYPVTPNPALFPCAMHRREHGWGHETFHGTWERLLAGEDPMIPAITVAPTRREGSAYDALVRS